MLTNGLDRSPSYSFQVKMLKQPFLTYRTNNAQVLLIQQQQGCSTLWIHTRTESIPTGAPKRRRRSSATPFDLKAAYHY